MSSGQINNTIEIRIVIDADASGGFSVTAPRALTIVDATVVATATNGGGTLTVSSGGNGITDAIACATNDAIDRAASIDSTFATLSSGASITVTANGAGDRGEVTLFCHAPGQVL